MKFDTRMHFFARLNLSLAAQAIEWFLSNQKEFYVVPAGADHRFFCYPDDWEEYESQLKYYLLDRVRLFSDEIKGEVCQDNDGQYIIYTGIYEDDSKKPH